MLTVQEVAEFRKINQWVDNAALSAATEAVNFYVDGLPNIDRLENGDWAPSTTYAALILAGRYYMRQNSVTGITAYGEDQNVFVTKYDADVARLLRIDGFQKPVAF